MADLKVKSPKKWKRDKKDNYKPRTNKKRGSSALQSQKRKKKKSQKQFKQWLKYLLLFGVVLAVLGLLFVIGLFIYYGRDLPDPNKLIDRHVHQSTKIYDRTAEHLLYEISGDEKRTLVEFDAIPQHAVEAVVAVEDKDFYEKKFGLSIKRNLKAVMYYVLSKVTNGRIHGPGASGITQQLVKNAILTSERSIQRKIKEWILTVQIESRFSKEEILQLYFNEIPYGSTAYGIESASQFYFGKSVSDITLAEGAILAAIINRPTFYSPYGNNRDALMERKELVLRLMHGQQYITMEELEEALAQEIEFKEQIEKIDAPHFVFYVRELLTEEYGYSEKEVEQGGLRVVTTLDYDMQKKAEETLQEKKEFLSEYEASNAALVSMDTQNGDILAMVGAIDYFDDENDGKVNVAVRPRQPGSSMKPLVYAVGFDQGYTPDTILYDVETIFKTEQNEDYIPHNYDLKEHGPISLKRALAGSLNIPAVKMIYLTGISNVLDKLDELGYTTLTDRSRFGLSLVLGGGEVTLVEHVNAFAAFAQDGYQPKKRAILSVEKSDGSDMREFSSSGKQVWDEEIARQVANVLSDKNNRLYVFGDNPNFSLPNQPAATKTGTTNDYRDAWFMGFTPEIVTGVWVGNNDNEKMRRGAAGGVVAAPLWDAYMTKVHEDRERSDFIKPKPIEVSKAVLQGEVTEFQVVQVDSVSGKLATDFTPSDLVEERFYSVAHSILHYVIPADPQGPIPSEDQRDPAYQLWEDGITAWLQKEATDEDEESGDGNDEGEEIPASELTKEYCVDGSDDENCEKMTVYIGRPPTEFDDVHTAETVPQVEIIFPSDFAFLDQNNQNTQAIASSQENDITWVEYYLDDQLLGGVGEEPFVLNYDLSIIPNGFYTLRAVAFDDIGNRGEDTITVEVSTEKPPLTVNWMGPKNNATVSLQNFPVTISAFTQRYAEIEKVDIYTKSSFGSNQLAGSVFTPTSSIINYSWRDIVLPGFYEIWMVIQTTSNEIVETTPVSIQVIP